MCAVKTSLAGQLERQSGGGGDDDDDDQDNDEEDINDDSDDDDDDDWWWWWVSFQKDGVVVNWPLHCRDTFTRGLPESPGLSLSWACLARCLYLYLITFVQIQLHLLPARVSPPRHVSFSGMPCRLLVLILVTVLGYFSTSTGTLAPCRSLLGLSLSRVCLAP